MSESGLQAQAVVDITSVAQFEALIIEPGRAALVDFWGEGCGPCRVMAPHFQAVAEQVSADALGEAVIFAKINTAQVPQLARAFNIRSVPTLVALNGSKVVDVHVGAAPQPTLRNLAARALKKAGLPLPESLKKSGGFLRGLFGA